ncbi:MAG: hypothetical protein DMG39_11950 [Acidobacteria bacterium]|nr:MAG: hypothetical protein DMG39_11950 [Acidobacteriota bacterium]
MPQKTRQSHFSRYGSHSDPFIVTVGKSKKRRIWKQEIEQWLPGQKEIHAFKRVFRQTQSVGEAGGVPHGLQDTAVLMKVFSAPEN